MTTDDRRYDIDWLRVIAIGLLLVYHSSISFQSWGFMLGFITNDKPFESLWIPMTMLNVWRIPLLFFISGMGVYFACRRRNWPQLLQERAKRILVPFLFGVFFLVPLQISIIERYYHQSMSYSPNPAHLWFLGNIFIYLLLLLPAFYYVKRNEKGVLVGRIQQIMSHPICLFIVVAAFIAETWLTNPMIYELYAMTWHGFLLGLLAFIVGFLFVLGGDPFWNMLMKWRWLFLTMAIGLYIYRLLQAAMNVPHVLLSIESNCWIFSAFSFGYCYLNHPGKVLRYMSQAAYPIYIIHMLFLNLASVLVIPLDMAAPWKFVLVLMLVIGGCFTTYEFLIRRIRILRFLFGLRISIHGSPCHTH